MWYRECLCWWFVFFSGTHCYFWYSCSLVSVVAKYHLEWHEEINNCIIFEWTIILKVDISISSTALFGGRFYLDVVQASAGPLPMSSACPLSGPCASQSQCSRSRYTSSPVVQTYSYNEHEFKTASCPGVSFCLFCSGITQIRML